MGSSSTGAARAKNKTVKQLDLSIKPSGRGYLITDGTHEMIWTPLGNIPPDIQAQFVTQVRNALRAYAK